MLPSTLQSALCWGLFTLSLWLLGCGSPPGPWPRAAARGEVTLDGEPLKTGRITFFPAPGTEGPAAGTEIVNGRFSLSVAEGPVVGLNRVVIRSVQETGRMVPYPGLIESDGPPVEGQMVKEHRNVIPLEYNSQSTLEWNIEADQVNQRNFQLTSEEPQKADDQHSRVED